MKSNSSKYVCSFSLTTESFSFSATMWMPSKVASLTVSSGIPWTILFIAIYKSLTGFSKWPVEYAPWEAPMVSAFIVPASVITCDLMCPIQRAPKSMHRLAIESIISSAISFTWGPLIFSSLFRRTATP